MVHYVAAGLFTYFLLRALRISWTGSITGGMAYQLTGVVASLVNPGHDGKLFVSALLPLAFLGLILGIRKGRWEGYGLLAIAVGSGLLAHVQMLYYMLVAAAIFTLYLIGEPTERPARPPVVGMGLALAGVAVGFGIATIQLCRSTLHPVLPTVPGLLWV